MRLGVPTASNDTPQKMWQPQNEEGELELGAHACTSSTHGAYRLHNVILLYANMLMLRNILNAYKIENKLEQSKWD